MLRSSKATAVCSAGLCCLVILLSGCGGNGGGSPAQLGDCTKFPSVPYHFEASGAVWHEAEGLLFAVGDEGQLAGFDPDGNQKLVKRLPFADIESITVVPTRDRFLYLGIEYPAEIVEYSLDSFSETGNRWKLPSFPGDSKAGMEALTFVPSSDEPSSGNFLAGSQKDGTVTAYKVDFAKFGSSVAEKTSQVFSFGLKEVSGLSYNPVDDDIWAVADDGNNMVVFDRNGTEKRRSELQIKHAEGVAPLVSLGRYYLAEDEGKRGSSMWMCRFNVSHTRILV